MLLWECAKDGLAPELVRALEDAAAEFAAAGGPGLTVTSGRRSLRRQAELMAAMTDRQLLALYARHGMPDYIQTLLDRRAAGTAVDADATLDILKTRREGYISAHLSGGAADLAITPDLDLSALRAILDRHGFDTLDETAAGLPCLHCRLRILPLVLVRD